MARRGTKYLLILFFGTLIFAGDSFKIGGVNVCGLVLMLLVFHLGATLLIGRRPQLELQHLPLIVLTIIFLLIGIARYPIQDVFEDLLPFLIFVIIATSLSPLKLEDRLQLLRFIVIVSALCILKVLAISYFDLQVSWGGDTFWQAAKVPLPSGLNRVVLKGADIFICISATLLLAGMFLRGQLPSLLGRSVDIVLLIPLLASVGLTFSRASAAAIFGGLLLWVVRLRRAGAIDRKKLVISAALFATIVVAASGSTFYSAVYDRWLGAKAYYGAEYRVEETMNAVEAASDNAFLGGGFGSHYYTIVSGSKKDDGRSLYAHSLPVWLLLKVGLFGLALFYYTLFRVIKSSDRNIAIARESNPEFAALLAVSLSGLFFLVLNDLVSNKFATASGASAYALLVSMVQATFARNAGNQQRQNEAQSPAVAGSIPG